MPPPLLLQELPEPVAVARGVRLLLWRDDLAHPDLPGNKARKLKYNLAAARQQGYHTLLTFGGASAWRTAPGGWRRTRLGMERDARASNLNGRRCG